MDKQLNVSGVVRQLDDDSDWENSDVSYQESNEDDNLSQLSRLQNAHDALEEAQCVNYTDLSDITDQASLLSQQSPQIFTNSHPVTSTPTKTQLPLHLHLTNNAIMIMRITTTTKMMMMMHKKNLRYHFPTCYAYSVKEPIGELALDEDTGVFSSFFSLLSSSSLGQTAVSGNSTLHQ